MNESGTENRSLTVGVNLGMAIEAMLSEAHTQLPAEPQAPEEHYNNDPPPATVVDHKHEDAMSTHEEEMPRDVPGSARIVAVEFPIGVNVPRGNITMLAKQRYKGRIIVGPSHAFSGRIPPDRFAAQLREVELTFDWFGFAQQDERRKDGTVIKAGTITKQGSLVNYVPGVRECPQCGHIYALNPTLEKRLKEMAGDNNHCHQPACVAALKEQGKGPAELRWRRAPTPAMRPDDPIVSALYSAFCTEKPVLDERALIPRVWGIYPGASAPTDWTPAKDDWKAQMIMKRCQEKNGSTIRPYAVVRQVQQDVVRQGHPNACQGLIVETTFTRDGVFGPAIGWIRPATLNPEPKTEHRMFGYKVRLSGRKHRPVGKQDTRVREHTEVVV